MKAQRGFGIRARFLAAGVLQVITTVAAAAWTLLVLSRLAAVSTSTVRDTDEATATTAAISSALEREDDALLVILGGARAGRDSLATARALTDRTLSRLEGASRSAAQARVAHNLLSSVGDYRGAVDALVVAPGEHPLERYHRQANPLLRAAVADVGHARDERFEQARAATARARDEVTRARRVVILISALAMLVAAIVALRLARHVILPLRQLAAAAQAIRDGEFATMLDARPADEIGDVANAFNEMTRRLAEFHRSNLGEVLRTKRVLEATMRALPDAVLLIDAEGRVGAANPEAEQLFRRSGRQMPLTAEKLATALAPASPHFRACLVQQQTLDRVALDDALHVEIGAEIRRFMPRIVPLAPAEQQGGVVLVLSDVTYLARLDEMRTELVAVASHELRTPVTTLRMSLLMLREAADDLDPRIRDLVNTALGGVDLLGETVDEVLDMTRIEAGRLMLNADTVDILGLIGEVVVRSKPRADELGLVLSVTSPPSVPPLIGDRPRLRIVLDNILNNALKYTPRGGTIQIRVRALRGTFADSSQRVEIAVTDSGCGIPPAFRGRIFEKFFRVEHYRARAAPTIRGSGIGLYLCKEIVELHGGTIRCEEPEASAGTQIVFDLPNRGLGRIES